MSCLAQASVPACSVDQLIEPTRPSRYVMSPAALNEVPDETKRAWAVDDIEAHLARGNAFAREALAGSKRAAAAFEEDAAGTFLAESVLLAAALTDGNDALEQAEDEAAGWRGYTDVATAAKPAHELHFALRQPADDFGGFLDEELGIPISDTKGRPAARVDSLALVAEVHLKEGKRLDAKAARLADAEGEQAALGGQALAAGYVGEQSAVQAGTERYYIGRMERSDASDEAKAHFVFHAGAHDSPYYGTHDPALEECALNEVGLAAMTRTLEQASEARVREASAKLRAADPPLGADFTRDAGRMTSLLVTTPGDKARLHLTVDLPLVGAGKTASGGLHLEFDNELENDDGQYKLTSKLAIGVYGELDLKFASLRLALAGLGTLEARGDNGYEIWDLLRFGIREAIVGECPWAAGLIDGTTPVEMADSLDDDDYVEVAAGFKVEGGGTMGVGEDEDEAQARYEQVWGTRYEKDKRGGLKETRYKDFTASITASVAGGFGGELKWKARKPERGPIRDHSLELKASKKMRFDDIVEMFGEGTVAASMAGQVVEGGADLARTMARKGGAKLDGSWVEMAKRGARGAAVDKRAFASLDRRLGEDGSVARDVSIALGVEVSDGKPSGKLTVELTNALELDIGDGVVELGIETSRKLVEAKF